MNEIKRVGYGSMRAKAYMKEETTTTSRSYCSFGSLLSDEKYKTRENFIIVNRIEYYLKKASQNM